MELLARASPSVCLPFLVNTSEPATVLTLNQSLTDFGFVDYFVPPSSHIDACHCEPATTVDAAWTTVCDSRCSMHQFADHSSSSSLLELDIYQFDASRLAWTFGRLGLHRQFIVAFTNNGSTFFEEPSVVNLGVTFEFLILPHLCVRPRLELANPECLESMRVLLPSSGSAT
eukprot:1677144-Amphidinium_carterae.1